MKLLLRQKFFSWFDSYDIYYESGRGAYICYNLECLEKAKKSKRIEKSLEIPISEEIYSQIENIIKKQSGGDVIG